MAQNNLQARSRGSVSLDDPTQSLLHDHNYVRQLLQHYFGTEDERVRQQAGQQICDALLMHTTLEEAVFYPHVQALDPALVEKCEDDHQVADELLVQLQELQPGEPAYDELMQQLQDSVIAHMDIEEQQLFPAVRSAAIDLQDLALRMQAYEANLISTQASGGRGAQPGSGLH